MHIDFKETVWYRFYVPDNVSIEEVKRLLEEKKITFSNEAFDEFPEGYGEYMMDSSDSLTPGENGGNATIEAYDDGNLFFMNYSIVEEAGP